MPLLPSRRRRLLIVNHGSWRRSNDPTSRRRRRCQQTSGTKGRTPAALSLPLRADRIERPHQHRPQQFLRRNRRSFHPGTKRRKIVRRPPPAPIKLVVEGHGSVRLVRWHFRSVTTKHFIKRGSDRIHLSGQSRLEVRAMVAQVRLAAFGDPNTIGACRNKGAAFSESVGDKRIRPSLW
jgi:hypothetical protein